jgi:prepilin-type N-terminal cleavage/methylation domain-containing protein
MKNLIKFKKYQQVGFTLVELAVVLLVIGILAGLVLRNYSGFTGSARDTRRLADLRNITVLLSSYYTRNNGIFPTTSYATDSNSWTQGFANDLQQRAVIDNVNDLPKDPQHPSKFYRYFACRRQNDATGTAYLLVTEMETPTSNQQFYRESATTSVLSLCDLTGTGFSTSTLCYPQAQRYCIYNY